MKETAMTQVVSHFEPEYRHPAALTVSGEKYIHEDLVNAALKRVFMTTQAENATMDDVRNIINQEIRESPE